MKGNGGGWHVLGRGIPTPLLQSSWTRGLLCLTSMVSAKDFIFLLLKITKTFMRLLVTHGIWNTGIYLLSLLKSY